MSSYLMNRINSATRGEQEAIARKRNVAPPTYTPTSNYGFQDFQKYITNKAVPLTRSFAPKQPTPQVSYVPPTSSSNNRQIRTPEDVIKNQLATQQPPPATNQPPATQATPAPTGTGNNRTVTGRVTTPQDTIEQLMKAKEMADLQDAMRLSLAEQERIRSGLGEQLYDTQRNIRGEGRLQEKQLYEYLLRQGLTGGGMEGLAQLQQNMQTQKLLGQADLDYRNMMGDLSLKDLDAKQKYEAGLRNLQYQLALNKAKLSGGGDSSSRGSSSSSNAPIGDTGSKDDFEQAIEALKDRGQYSDALAMVQANSKLLSNTAKKKYEDELRFEMMNSARTSEDSTARMMSNDPRNINAKDVSRIQILKSKNARGTITEAELNELNKYFEKYPNIVGTTVNLSNKG